MIRTGADVAQHSFSARSTYSNRTCGAVFYALSNGIPSKEIGQTLWKKIRFCHFPSHRLFSYLLRLLTYYSHWKEVGLCIKLLMLSYFLTADCCYCEFYRFVCKLHSFANDSCNFWETWSENTAKKDVEIVQLVGFQHDDSCSSIPSISG